ncbi:hypothetical protein EYR41_006330 [Orbilia oligospora]|uniref:Molybdenum cofactor sulfurase n=1 Tax=Orbilia oligospora TaxID=2813651 RepID=A0A7C8PKX0_ORBOL|nr:hypothetical protein TWF751_010650 [Orbilia oligospora]TGJ70364.1 hypothetical protein EYR41_006330 [Orbilia oligospora]
MTEYTVLKAGLKKQLEEIERLYPGASYNVQVEQSRQREYPQLNGITYLDHAAATLYSSSLIDVVSSDLKQNLFGNPHSLSPSSLETTRRIQDTRVRVLQLFNADPEHFDVVFCGNTTAAIKLVADAFVAQDSDVGSGFQYRLHEDSHTSLVGIRQVAGSSQALSSNKMSKFVNSKGGDGFGLMVYPAQSNMTGQRYPLSWAGTLRQNRPGWYTLLDAAGLVTTSPLDLSDISAAPDFVALSFYKMFGYPDLGGLIVRKASSSVLRDRKYFGGGTVSFVVNPFEHPSNNSPHAIRKSGDPHEYLEDGTVPFHSIIALDHAISDHRRLYNDFKRISQHTQALGTLVYESLKTRQHVNGTYIADIYTDRHPSNPSIQGATFAFNLRKSDGSFVGFNDVLKLASVRDIHLRTGGLCNPGGVMKWMNLSEQEMRKNFADGKRCGDEWDLMNGKPTGAVRISLGAMSTLDDVARFLSFIDEFYVEKTASCIATELFPPSSSATKISKISIYPIKSCAAFDIPASKPWRILTQGLEYDREFCLIHQGTGKVMDMKMYPKMALVRPFVDLETRELTISCKQASTTLRIPLDDSLPTHSHPITKKCNSKVCGDTVVVQAYSEKRISEWLSDVLGVPCTLARYPSAPDGGGRYMKNHLRQANGEIPIALRNESPILVVNRKSIDPINNMISKTGGKLSDISVFRSNIIVDGPQPFDEDRWLELKFRNSSSTIQLLGPCRRCHMICINQTTSERSPEPFVTLSKLRTVNGKVYFGHHAAFISDSDNQIGLIQVGDELDISYIDLDSSDTDSGESCSSGNTAITADTAVDTAEPAAEQERAQTSCILQ